MKSSDRRDQRDHQDLGGPGRADLPAPAHRPVHRLLQLLATCAEVAAVKLGDTLETASVGGVWLLLAAIAVTAVVDIIIPQAIAKWAILAPIFIPLFLRLGVGAADRARRLPGGRLPGNVITR